MKTKFHRFFMILFIISTLFLGVGYASITSRSFSVDGDIASVVQDGVFVTDVVYESSVDADISSSKINNMRGTMVSSYIKLNNNPESEITYTITIYNSTNNTYYFDGVVIMEMEDDSTYTNDNITYVLSGLKEHDPILSKDTITFDVTFKYLNTDSITETDLFSIINYKFSSLFNNGQRVYFDVEKGVGCTMEEYALSYDSSISDFRNSLTGYNGLNGDSLQNSCLLFYAFNDDGTDNLNLILDHNLTAATAWANTTTTTNKNGPILILSELKNLTASWNGTITPDNYTVSQTGYGNYTIPYNTSGYKAKIISAQEVAKIVGADVKEGLMFNENTNSGVRTFFFDSLTSTASTTCKSGNTTGCKFGWLYDRTRADCENYGCYNNCEASTYGYWTSTSYFGDTGRAWSVDRDGSLYASGIKTTTYQGVRPVIIVDRENVRRGFSPAI